MKLLVITHDPENLSAVRSLMENNGVPVYIKENGAGRGVRGPWHVFICMDEQYDDGVKLLHDPNHVVRPKHDVQKYYDEQRRAGLVVLSKWASVALAVSLSLLILVAVMAS